MESNGAARRTAGCCITVDAIVALISHFLVGGMISVESIMRYFSVCKHLHASKRILVDVVKDLMPEVPRDRWGVVATASPREYLILYRNYWY